MLVLCDDGRSTVSDYAELFEIGDELHRRYPFGWGLLIIIPPNAVPPSEPVRNAINDTLNHAHDTLRGVSWAIEGGGFQGATARAVLTGMRFLTRAPYDRNISRSVDESLAWLLPMISGADRHPDLSDASSFIAARRDALTRFESAIRATESKAISNAE
ncbi:MAG: hypothetical protein ABW352_08660 [Polyangiales bacterium]